MTIYSIKNRIALQLRHNNVEIQFYIKNWVK